MKKSTKGAVAATAAVALLAGGAGSLAYWSDSGTVNGGTITSGKLTLTPSATAGSWSNGANTISNISTYRVVPGDVLVYTKGFTLAAAGNNLTATVGVDPASVTGALVGTGGATVTTQVLEGATPVTTVTAADDTKALTAKVTFTFPTTVSGTTLQTATADLSTLALRVTQTAPGTSGN
ncbi:alternate-type signal peptide domain-containing protein [Solicola sp. PLA-1-18]|uniref:alternate-type signal peptide domain-containing protein n=1 Tax=Solicola sp. PLA-1-18 TaxID=3380532 RepID=UPI003B76A1D5